MTTNLETTSNNLFSKVPVQDIFKSRIICKKTFYDRVKDGTFTLYKLGRRSYVDRAEFESAFRKVVIQPTV